MKHQKELFSIAKDITYLNGAYMAPQLKSVENIGLENLKKKSEPYHISEGDFFSEKIILKKRFARLIDASDHETIAIVPSVSYGIANAVANIPFGAGDEIIVLEEQFPSNYYAWKELEANKKIKIKTIVAPPIKEGRGALWNKAIFNAISTSTKCVALPHTHWADGTKFDLKKIRERTNEVGAYLIIDGTQSVGAMPFSVKELQPDALICCGYKWLMGPYSLGVAYFGERFHTGTPIENNWMNHQGSENFSNLVNYNHSFKPKATRFDVGESSNFILVPMLSEAIKQLIEWSPEAIQTYCKSITAAAIGRLQQLGCFIETSDFRGHHLFGIYLPKHMDMEKIKEKLVDEKIYVSYRGNAIRVSLNVYNTEEDLERLVKCFE